MENTDLEETQEIPVQEQKNTHPVLKVLLIILVIVCALGACGYILYSKTKSQIASTVGDKLVEAAAVEAGIPATEAENIVDSMDKNDKETVNEIVESHIDKETVDKAKEYVDNRDLAGAKQYAKEQLSPEEYEKLKEIAQKYIKENDALSSEIPTN